MKFPNTRLFGFFTKNQSSIIKNTKSTLLVQNQANNIFKKNRYFCTKSETPEIDNIKADKRYIDNISNLFTKWNTNESSLNSEDEIFFVLLNFHIQENAENQFLVEKGLDSTQIISRLDFLKTTWSKLNELNECKELTIDSTQLQINLYSYGTSFNTAHEVRGASSNLFNILATLLYNKGKFDAGCLVALYSVCINNLIGFKSYSEVSMKLKKKSCDLSLELLDDLKGGQKCSLIFYTIANQYDLDFFIEKDLPQFPHIEVSYKTEVFNKLKSYFVKETNNIINDLNNFTPNDKLALYGNFLQFDNNNPKVSIIFKAIQDDLPKMDQNLFLSVLSIQNNLKVEPKEAEEHYLHMYNFAMQGSPALLEIVLGQVKTLDNKDELFKKFGKDNLVNYILRFPMMDRLRLFAFLTYFIHDPKDKDIKTILDFIDENWKHFDTFMCMSALKICKKYNADASNIIGHLFTLQINHINTSEIVLLGDFLHKKEEFKDGYTALTNILKITLDEYIRDGTIIELNKCVELVLKYPYLRDVIDTDLLFTNFSESSAIDNQHLYKCLTMNALEM